MKIAIIGCGLIGQKRAQSLKKFPQCELVAVIDGAIERAEALAKQSPNCKAFSDWNSAAKACDIDMVIIATPHHVLAELTHAAVVAGKHVLVEKPAARNAKELEPAITASKKTGTLVRVGFNHRYHRALQKAKSLIQENALGELMFIRARYGHGGRIGYDKEWRAIPELSGGGELIDQGVHLIDLSRWFLGDFSDVQGFAHTYYWNMPVDDNGFLILKNDKQQVAFLHASCTEWKNLFSFEIYGRDGKIDINGLGGSYGVERLAYYKMLPQMGPPETTIWEYPMADNSWDVEFEEFLQDIKLNRQPNPNLEDAHATLMIVQQIYSQQLDFRRGNTVEN